jgi:acyl carrier protein
MAAIWADVIGDPQIGPDADFFELGANSLTAVALMSGITQEFGIELPVAELLDHRTIRSLTEVVRAEGAR